MIIILNKNEYKVLPLKAIAQADFIGITKGNYITIKKIRYFLTIKNGEKIIRGNIYHIDSIIDRIKILIYK